MLLRETCLMSMANKRVAASEVCVPLLSDPLSGGHMINHHTRAACFTCLYAGEERQRSFVSEMPVACGRPATGQREPEHRQPEHSVSVQDQQVHQRTPSSSTGGEDTQMDMLR